MEISHNILTELLKKKELNVVFSDSETDMNYQEAYYFLFNEISDLIIKLQEIQKQAEEIVIGKQ